MAAASLTEAFIDLGSFYEEQFPGVEVNFNFAGSQQLAQQIIQGASADVFASANLNQMQAVVDSGNVLESKISLFAANQLVVIFPAENPARIEKLQDLSRSGVKLVLAAKEVPAGQYTLEFLTNAARDPAFGASFDEEVLRNVVSYENNVRAVLTKVSLGEADAGIVYTSDVQQMNSPGDAGIGTLPVPAELGVTALYPIAPLNLSSNPDAAQAFIDLVLSAQGQEVLASYGFQPVDEDGSALP
jgi:molybdate transport system substrate-binding protein